MDKRRKTKKRNIAVLAILAFIAVLIISFISYWQFALHEVNNFTTVDFSHLKAGRDYITIRGAEIHYVRKGSGDKSIILVHGIGGGAFTFRNNIDELADAGYSVFAIDLKGFGFSEKPIGSDYSHIEQARIVIDFMEKNDIQKATVAGHSMGGRIALICYDMYPEKFENIILIDSAGLEEAPPALLSNLLIKPIMDIIYYNLFVKKDNFRGFLSSAFYYQGFVDDNVIGLYLEPFRVKDSNLAYLSIIKGNIEYDIEAVLKRIDIPVLIVWGQQDSWISVENAYRFNSLIKGSELALIQKAGHVPMEEQPEIVNEEIIRFLK